MGRYNDINRGPELNKAYEKYQEWVKKSRAQKQTEFKTVSKSSADRVITERTDGYILPFNSQNDKIYLIGRVISSTQQGQGAATANTARGLIDDRFLKEPPTGTDVQTFDVEGYQFAKIVVTQRTQTATTESESRITGRQYKRHRSDNVSGIFGRKSATDEYSAAVREIHKKEAFETFVKVVGNRIGFKPEIG